MFAAFATLLTRPAAGPIASVLALLLAIGLGASVSASARREAHLQSELKLLSDRQVQAAVRWRAELDACHAQASAPSPRANVTRVDENDASVAERLANQGPAGFDACARMQAADASVLATLGTGGRAGRHGR